jgi:ligand-binding sensor domain-containing protein
LLSKRKEHLMRYCSYTKRNQETESDKTTQEKLMNVLIKNIALLILSSTIISSCKGQVKSNDKSSKTEKTQVASEIPVPKNGFSNALVDKDSTIWFSSNGGGIYHYNGKTFKNYTEEDGLSSNQVFSIASDQNDNLWFGTQNGLTKYDRKKFEHIALPYQDTTSGWISTVYPVLNPNAAHSLAVGNNDNLWIGTGGGGAYLYDGISFKPYLTEIGWKYEGSFQNWIPFIRKDNKGNMWFASMSNGGVNQFNGEKFTQYLLEDGLSDNQVRTIYCDKSGKIWIGFNGNRNSGLTVYNGKSFKTFSLDDGLCNQRIRSIYEDKNGSIWMGADLANLCVFDGENFSDFNYNGQTFSDILFILSDLEDNIWFGGRNGIWKYDGQNLTEITTNE